MSRPVQPDILPSHPGRATLLVLHTPLPCIRLDRKAGVHLIEGLIPFVFVDGLKVCSDLPPQPRFERGYEDLQPLLQTGIPDVPLELTKLMRGQAGL